MWSISGEKLWSISDGWYKIFFLIPSHSVITHKAIIKIELEWNRLSIHSFGFFPDTSNSSETEISTCRSNLLNISCSFVTQLIVMLVTVNVPQIKNDHLYSYLQTTATFERLQLVGIFFSFDIANVNENVIQLPFETYRRIQMNCL